MFAYAVKFANNTAPQVKTVSAAAAVASSYTYSNPIDLHLKIYDNKILHLKVDIMDSGLSGILNVNYTMAEASGSTYANVITGSGTSLLIASGTSGSGKGSNGSYYIPLSIVHDSGCTKWLTSVPYLKIGACASNTDVTSQMFVCL